MVSLDTHSSRLGMIRRIAVVLCLALGTSIALLFGSTTAHPAGLPAFDTPDPLEHGASERTVTLEPTVPGRVAPRTPEVRPSALQSDTLRRSVPTGETLIVALPASLGNAPVERYHLLHGPSLSGVADRSFAWVTTSIQPGTYEIRLGVQTAASRDTLVLQVDVR